MVRRRQWRQTCHVNIDDNDDKDMAWYRRHIIHDPCMHVGYLLNIKAREDDDIHSLVSRIIVHVERKAPNDCGGYGVADNAK